jgi:LuxR family maltose regulon positive regulatory protein
VLEVWIDAAEAILTASLLREAQENARLPQTRQEQQDLLAEIIAFRANLRSYRGDGRAALEYCQQALALLSEHSVVRVHVAYVQLWALYASSANNAGAAIDCGLQGGLLAQKIGQTAAALSIMSSTANCMIGAGRLHEAQRLSQQAMLLGRRPGGLVLPEVGWPALLQAETLREWNHLDAALALAEEALSQCKECRSNCSIAHEFVGYEVLLRIHLSRGELDAARWALQQVESIGMNLNRYFYLHLRSYFTTTDQVRLWLACGELDHAVRWAEALDVAEQDGTPLERERQEVARARIFFATKQPALALQRLEPVQERATTGKCWGHLIEIRLLQALAYEGLQEETQALNALSEALQVAEPEGYIRSFLDEGAPMEVLLYQLRRKHLQHGPTPYLDTVLAAFQHEHKELPHQPKRGEERPNMQALPDPLSEREREVLQLLACGVSNQEIAEELVIAIDTVKRHVSRIFSKLGVHNRLQAERQARELGLLREEH